MTWAAMSLPRPSTLALPASMAARHRGDVALDDHGDVAAAELLAGQHLDVGRLAGRVDGLEDGGEALRLDQAHGEIGLLRSWLALPSVLPRIMHALACSISGLNSGAASIGRPRAARRGAGITSATIRHPHRLGDAAAGADRGVTSATGPCRSSGKRRLIVQLGLEHAHAGGLLHGVERHHGGRPAAHLDQRRAPRSHRHPAVRSSRALRRRSGRSCPGRGCRCAARSRPRGRRRARSRPGCTAAPFASAARSTFCAVGLRLAAAAEVETRAARRRRGSRREIGRVEHGVEQFQHAVLQPHGLVESGRRGSDRRACASARARRRWWRWCRRRSRSAASARAPLPSR